MKRYWPVVLAVALVSGCVSATRYKESQTEAETWKGKAQAVEFKAGVLEGQLASRSVELDTAKKEIDLSKSQGEALKSEKAAAADVFGRIQGELTSRAMAADEKLASAEQQVGSLKASVRDLQKSSESSQSELTKKVASLVSEKDHSAQKLAEAQAAAASLRAAKDGEIGELTRKLNAAIEEKTKLSEAKAAAEAAIVEAERSKEAARLEAEKAKEAEVAKVKQSYEDLASSLKSEIQAGEIKLTQLQGKLTVQLVDKILFDSGSDDIKPAGRKVLARIGKLLNEVQGKDMRIEGHTDNVPISDELRSRFASNWELSTARATAVARYLQDAAKVDPKRLAATGYGEYRPVAPNDKPETRALNRRIEIILIPKE